MNKKKWISLLTSYLILFTSNCSLSAKENQIVRDRGDRFIEGGLVFSIKSSFDQNVTVSLENQQKYEKYLISNLPTINEHLFFGFPLSGVIQASDIEGKVITSRYTDKQGWLKPSDLSSSIFPDWEYLKSTVIPPSVSVTSSFKYAQMLKFITTSKIFGNREISRIKIGFDIVYLEKEIEKCNRITTNWISIPLDSEK